MHEHLIAPRPVRIASNPLLPYNNIRRQTPSSIRSPGAMVSMKFVPPLSPTEPLAKPPHDNFDAIVDDQSPRSTPATPRSPGPLPPETLEEFLSILRPSVMPFHSLRVYSTSPIRTSLRSHTPLGALTAGSSDSTTPMGSPDAPIRQDNKPPFSSHSSWQSDKSHSELESIIPIWRSGGILSSPVSRTHTRNPFARRPSHENLALAMSHNPSFVQQQNTGSLDRTPLSPTLIPLPPSTSPPPLSMMQEPKDALVH